MNIATFLTLLKLLKNKKIKKDNIKLINAVLEPVLIINMNNNGKKKTNTWIYLNLICFLFRNKNKIVKKERTSIIPKTFWLIPNTVCLPSIWPFEIPTKYSKVSKILPIEKLNTAFTKIVLSYLDALMIIINTIIFINSGISI